jgi:hypothetical protein
LGEGGQPDALPHHRRIGRAAHAQLDLPELR